MMNRRPAPAAEASPAEVKALVEAAVREVCGGLAGLVAIVEANPTLVTGTQLERAFGFVAHSTEQHRAKAEAARHAAAIAGAAFSLDDDLPEVAPPAPRTHSPAATAPARPLPPAPAPAVDTPAPQAPPRKGVVGKALARIAGGGVLHGDPATQLRDAGGARAQALTKRGPKSVGFVDDADDK